MLAIDPILFRYLLYTWYTVHQRSLPWRTTQDPYKIWLSEVILQQTRVAQGLPYYERFVTQYPSVKELANATEQEVLRLWQGLGYYSRARNLHHCACTIVEKYNGVFPTSYQKLLTLKGIGPYTAAAIAAIAFNEAVAAVDGNVYRVLSRIFGIESDIGTVQGRKQLHQLATLLVDPKQPNHYAQAIMDFGALQCIPSLPLCNSCIFKPYCNAFQTNKQQKLPINSHKVVKRRRYFDYIIVQHGDVIYMKKRTKRDIWRGMYDFYLIEAKVRLSLDQLEDPLLVLLQTYHIPIVSLQEETRHLLTHQELLVKFHSVNIASDCLAKEITSLLHSVSLKPFSYTAIEQLPKAVLIQKFLQELLEETKEMAESTNQKETSEELAECNKLPIPTWTL